MLYLLVKRKVFLEMALQSERSLDQTDWKIICELQQDARLSSNELGRRVGLSAPATAERVRKLEDAGVITGYRAHIDPAKLGMPLLALRGCLDILRLIVWLASFLSTDILR